MDGQDVSWWRATQRSSSRSSSPSPVHAGEASDSPDTQDLLGKGLAAQEPQAQEVVDVAVKEGERQQGIAAAAATGDKGAPQELSTPVKASLILHKSFFGTIHPGCCAVSRNFSVWLLLLALKSGVLLP